jgi:hypothetical protein
MAPTSLTSETAGGAARCCGPIYAWSGFVVMWAFWTSFVIFLADPRWAADWPLPTVDRGGIGLHAALAALADLALIALFGLQHSVMARPWFKTTVMARLPAAFERCTYVHAANLAPVRPDPVLAADSDRDLACALAGAGGPVGRIRCRLPHPPLRCPLLRHVRPARHRADARVVPRRAATSSSGSRSPGSWHPRINLSVDHHESQPRAQHGIPRVKTSRERYENVTSRGTPQRDGDPH